MNVSLCRFQKQITVILLFIYVNHVTMENKVDLQEYICHIYVYNHKKSVSIKIYLLKKTNIFSVIFDLIENSVPSDSSIKLSRSISMHVDQFTRRTFIQTVYNCMIIIFLSHSTWFSIFSAYTYAIPPIINSYRKRFSVGELILKGYATISDNLQTCTFIFSYYSMNWVVALF